MHRGGVILRKGVGKGDIVKDEGEGIRLNITMLSSNPIGGGDF